MFLTLLEAPGTRKLAGFEDLNAAEMDDDSSEEEGEFDERWSEEDGCEADEIEPNCMDAACLTNMLDPEDLSSRWRRDFSKRPTWYDAGLALQQILKGRATGFKAPLYSRVFIQRTLFSAGCFVQNHAWLIIITILAMFSFCSFGLRYVHIETDIVKLWVSESGGLNGELKYLENIQQKYRRQYKPDLAYLGRNFIPDDPDPRLNQIPEDEAPTSSYQVLIQTADPASTTRNLLTREELLKHVKLLEEVTQLSVNKFGMNWTLDDICFKPGALDIEKDSLAYSLKSTLELLIPCIWITPIDCYFEGAKPLGPSPPIDTKNIPMGPLLRMLMSNIPDHASWANIDPQEIIQQVVSSFDLGTIENFFGRSGIGHGYMQRPCIDPLDPKCPPSAPNYYSTACDALQFLEDILAKKNETLEQFLAPFEDVKVPDAKQKSKSKATSPFDILGAFFGASDSSSERENITTYEKNCKKYRTPFLRWMSLNWAEAESKFGEKLLPKFPNYGQLMEHGCYGVAKNVMNWPADMILGGVKKDENGELQAEALQSVFLVATPTEVFRRFKDSNKFASNTSFAANDWSPLAAKEIIQAWARAFTNELYNHELNKDQRLVHPLASNSISDMLAEFCNFNYMIILLGYVLMLGYALYSQCRFDGCCSLGVESAVGLALAGVLTVTLSSVAGLGISTWLGINFNAATTQIIPFLALGIGVDNVFLLLHNYPQVVSKIDRDELGFLLKETGMSILTTSLNNILAFWAGTILPIPALRSFCGQTAILLTANLVGIFLAYPAFIALDLKRRKAGRRDMAFLGYYCLCLDESVGTVRHDKLLQKASSNKKLIKTSQFDEEDPPYYFNPALISGGKHMKPEILIAPTKMGSHPIIRHHSSQRDGGKRKKQYKWYTLQGFLHLVYIPLLRHKIMKIGILLSVLGLFLFGVYGITLSNIGLELSDVLPEYSAPAAFLKTRDRFFSFYPMSIVLRGEHIDFPSQQHQIDLLRNEIGRSQYVIKLLDGEPSEHYWLQLFREWLRGMQQRLDEAKRNGWLEDFDSPNSTVPKSPDLQIAYSLACSYGENYDCARAGQVRLVDESGTVNAEGFYNYLYGWHEYEQMFYAVSQASFYPKLRKLRQGPPGRKYRYFIPPAPKPLFSRIPFYLTGLRDTSTIVRMIREIRAISENFTTQGLVNHPEGVAFTFWEQYLHLEYYLVLAIAIISVCVFLIISLIIFNPWAAAMVSLTVLSMTVELAGFMGWAGVKLNPISAVTLITAVGIGVEFTAHVVLAFLTSLGTRHERMEQCLVHMFVPVIHGGMSTLLGIVMLAFSEFDFVVKYFFVVMSALVIVGMLNGLAFLPVLLSFIGPPCEIKPVGGRRNRLPCPTRRTQQMRTTTSNVISSKAEEQPS